MKTLAQYNDYILAILDEDNYVVYDQSKPKSVCPKTGKKSYKYAYYSQIKLAVKELARLVANDECVALGDWMTIYMNTVDELFDKFEAPERTLGLR